MNVLHILSDQHAAHLLGCENHAQVMTPHLDRLAAEGTRFANAYCQNPICTPSRICYLSGQYCNNHGYYGLSGPTPGHYGTRPLPNLFGHFRKQGYRTALIGKTHLPHDPVHWLANDLDVIMDRPEHLQWLSKHHPELADLEDSCALPEYPGTQQLEGRPSNLPFEMSVEGWSVTEAIAFMKASARDRQPFCLQVSLYRPHQCCTPDRRFWDMYDDDLDLPATFGADVSHRPPHFRQTVRRFSEGQFWVMESPTCNDDAAFQRVARRIWRGYLASITHVDHAVGELMKFLNDSGLSSDTVVTYSSDHGAYATEFGLPEKAPGICSERVCRVPMLWRVPGRPAGVVSRALVETVDMAATFSHLCGLPPMQTVDGFDLSGLLSGNTSPLRAAAVTETAHSKAIRWDRWRLVQYSSELFPQQNIGELYDIENDSDETRNLYSEPSHAGVVAEGRLRLLDWMIKTRRITTLMSRDGGHPLAEDGTLPNDHRDRWRADEELANYV